MHGMRIWVTLRGRTVWFVACVAALGLGCLAAAAKPKFVTSGTGAGLLDLAVWLIPASVLAALALLGAALLDAYGEPRRRGSAKN